MRIVIVTCDAFSYVVPLTVNMLSKTWPDYRKLWTTVVTVSNASVDWIRLQSTGLINEICLLGEEEGWSNNMRKYLLGSTFLEKNEPILLLLEDYLMYDVQPRAIRECIRIIETYDDVGMIRLVPIPGPTIPWHDHRGRHTDVGMLDNKTHTSYCMSLQAALWKPQTLLETLEPDLNPWKTEGRGSRRIARGEICQRTQFLCTYKFTLKYKNMLRRGKQDPDVLDWLKRQGVDINAISRSTIQVHQENGELCTSSDGEESKA